MVTDFYGHKRPGPREGVLLSLRCVEGESQAHRGSGTCQRPPAGTRAELGLRPTWSLRGPSAPVWAREQRSRAQVCGALCRPQTEGI